MNFSLSDKTSEGFSLSGCKHTTLFYFPANLSEVFLIKKKTLLIKACSSCNPCQSMNFAPHNPSRCRPKRLQIYTLFFASDKLLFIFFLIFS